MLAQLKRNGVDILKGPDSDDNGTFAWVLDPDGNKVELWEPKAQTNRKRRSNYRRRRGRAIKTCGRGLDSARG
jgi:hypothetical protein